MSSSGSGDVGRGEGKRGAATWFRSGLVGLGGDEDQKRGAPAEPVREVERGAEGCGTGMPAVRWRIRCLTTQSF